MVVDVVVLVVVLVVVDVVVVGWAVVVVVVGGVVVVVVVVGAVQRNAAPGPLTVQTNPAQQVWLPSQGWPSPRHAGEAPAAPARPSAAPSRPPPNPRSRRRRDVPFVARRFVSSSNRFASMRFCPSACSDWSDGGLVAHAEAARRSGTTARIAHETTMHHTPHINKL